MEKYKKYKNPIFVFHTVIRKIRKVKDLTLLKEVIYRGSIVWDYFIRSKKIFSKIMD